jgi:CRISPR/Cas system-associated protein Cas5 (RAMP superfamily)
MKRNIWVWLAALLLAVFLWLQSVLLSQQEETVWLPLKFEPQPEELLLSSNENARVEVILQAKGINIFMFRQQDIYYQVDGSKLKYGKNSLHLIKENLTCSEKQLEFLSGFTQKVMIIEMDRIISRQKPVILTFASASDERFFLDQQLDVSSNIVQIKGPEKYLEKLENIKTKPVTKKDLKNNRLRVALDSPSPLIELNSSEIVIQFNSQVKTIKTIPLLPIIYSGNKLVDFAPRRVTVKIEGAESTVSEIDGEQIIANLIIDETRNSGYGKIVFVLPDGIKLLEYTPEKIRYSISEN